MIDDQKDKKLDLIKNQVRVLMQSFDTVHIFCTRYESGDDHNTFGYQLGDGNFMARYGQIRGWLLHEDARNSGVHNE